MSLNVGDKCPIFRLQNQYGDWIDLNDCIGKKNIVIYFYPKDDTKGCTKEACSFRNELKDFEALNAEIFGISSDTVSKHLNFSEKHKLNFYLLADINGEVKRIFEVKKVLFGLVSERITYVIGKDGLIKGVYSDLMRGEKHVEFAKEILKNYDKSY